MASSSSFLSTTPISLVPSDIPNQSDIKYGSVIWKINDIPNSSYESWTVFSPKFSVAGREGFIKVEGKDAYVGAYLCLTEGIPVQVMYKIGITKLESKPNFEKTFWDCVNLPVNDALPINVPPIITTDNSNYEAVTAINSAIFSNEGSLGWGVSKLSLGWQMFRFDKLPVNKRELSFKLDMAIIKECPNYLALPPKHTQGEVPNSEDLKFKNALLHFQEEALIDVLADQDLSDSERYMKADKLMFLINSVRKTYQEAKKISPTTKDNLINEFNFNKGRKEDGLTALQLAVWRAVCRPQKLNISTVDDLLSFGADPKVKNNFFSPLRLAIQKDNLEIVKKLIHAGADLNAVEEGETPLTFCISSNPPKIEMIEILLGNKAENKASPDKVNAQHETPLVLAIIKKQEKVVELLLNAGADPNIHPKGNSPLYLAVHHHLTESVHALVKAKANPNTFDFHNDETPLMMLVNALNIKGMRLLIENCKNIPDFINIANKRGQTALDFAVSIRYLNAIRYLNRINLLLQAGSTVTAGNLPKIFQEALSSDQRDPVVLQILRELVNRYPANFAITNHFIRLDKLTSLKREACFNVVDQALASSLFPSVVSGIIAEYDAPLERHRFFQSKNIDAEYVLAEESKSKGEKVLNLGPGK